MLEEKTAIDIGLVSGHGTSEVKGRGIIIPMGGQMAPPGYGTLGIVSILVKDLWYNPTSAVTNTRKNAESAESSCSSLSDWL